MDGGVWEGCGEGIGVGAGRRVVERVVLGFDGVAVAVEALVDEGKQMRGQRGRVYGEERVRVWVEARRNE